LGYVFGKVPFRFKGKNFFIRAAKTVEERYIGNANVFSKKEREMILLNPTGDYPPSFVTRPLYDDVTDADDITKMQYIDITMWLPGDILLKADKMGMAHSLKIRSPLLDADVFDVASKLPTNLRVTKKATKHAFRTAAALKLPPETALKKKLGFPVPLRVWLRDEAYYRIVRSRFESDAAKLYFKIDELVRLLDRHKAGKADNSRKIWTVYMFLVWYGVYFK
jgi:asparagine synthase (glutamine-hydrolysing)